MAYRGNRNRGNFGGGYNNGPSMGGGGGGGGGNRMNMSPWESQNTGGGGNYPGGGYMRQGGGGGGGGGGGQNMNVNALNAANNLLRDLLRNHPPSLLDLPRGGNMDGNRNRGGPMVNRSGGGSGGNRANRRTHGGFNNRGAAGAKPAPPKQGNGGGIRKQNAIDRARKLLAKNANNKKKDVATTGEKKTESKESIYANIHNDMFYCHLCKKHMWDAISFENHIKGRTHLMMREGIEESYRLRANMIRQEAKIAEQLKSIELDRLKNIGKNKHRNLDYCTMCDLNFHGHITTHRKSEGHLQLKKFLHPKCGECNKEFPTRIDYDTHLLSPEHLRIASEKNIKVGETKRHTLPILTEEDELKDIRPPQKRRRRQKKDAAAANGSAEGNAEENGEEGAEDKQEAGDAAVKTEDNEDEKAHDTTADDASTANETKEGDALNESGAKAEGAAAEQAEEEEEVPLPVDPEDCILDFNDGDDIPVEIDSRLPKYNWTRPVGATLITKLDCFECSLCGKYFDTEKTVEVHSRTVTHFRNFLKFINEKSSFAKFAQKRAAAALEESARKKRKLEESETTGDETKAEVKEEAEGEKEATENGGEANGELYDPSEATGEDEDAEMAENGEEAGDEQNGDAEAEDAAMGEEQAVAKEEPAKAVATPAPEPVAPAAAKPAPATPQPAAAAAAAAQPTPKKQETPKAEPVKATPVKQAAATPAADETPAKKATPAPRTPAARNTPRGRGRGRYTRY